MPVVRPLPLHGLLAATLAAGSGSAQGDVDVHDLLRRLRQPKTTAAQRAALVDDILAAGAHGALLLFNNTRNDYKSRHAAWRRALRKHLSSFAKDARKALAKRQGRRAKTRIAALREEARRVSRTRGLTKRQIRDTADRLHGELATLVEIRAHEVLAREKIAEEARALDALLARLEEYRTTLERARDVLRNDEQGRRHLARQKGLPDPRPYGDELARERDWLALLATPMTERDRKVLLANRALAGAIQPGEYRGILELNRIRLRAGLAALAIDVKLCNASRDHSKDMARLGFFSHTSPVPGKESFGKRAALAGTSASSENIAAGQSTGRGAIRAWWYSPGHHRNMMRGGGRVGLGRHQRYWTQMFGG